MDERLNAAVCLADEKQETLGGNPIAPKLDVFTTDAAIEEMQAQLVRCGIDDEDKVVKTVQHRPVPGERHGADQPYSRRVSGGFMITSGPRGEFFPHPAIHADRRSPAGRAARRGIEAGSARSGVDVLPHFLSGNPGRGRLSFCRTGAGP